MKNTPESLAAQSEALTVVRSVAEMRRAVEDDYRKALRNAHEFGCSLEQIGMAAGVTRQGIKNMLSRM